jgi:sugar lactone lactonase YvrE
LLVLWHSGASQGQAPEAQEQDAAASEQAPAAKEADAAAKEPPPVTRSVRVPSPIAIEGAEVVYPRAVALLDDQLLVVDLDLPGIWIQSGESLSVHTPGTKLLRKPMNRPWCVTPHPEGGILIGDSATREIYHAAAAGDELVALNNGYLGIPMAIAVGPGGKTIYVGDAERRAVFRLPIAGGKPELVARVNARGLSFDGDGNLWAVTPDAEAIQKIDIQKNTAETIVGDRPYQFPNGIVWTGEEGFVTDGYGKAIWRFSADGTTEKWFQGDPLAGPVGITADENNLYVADPQKKQVFRFDRKTKAVEPVF